MIKIFLWKFCRNTIQVRKLLRHKGISVPIICRFCKSDVEHMLYVFFDWGFVIQCWQKIGLVFNMLSVESAANWMLNKIETDTHDIIIKIATVLWGIWLVRNKKVREDMNVTPNLAVEWSSNHIAELRDTVKKCNSVGSENGVGRGSRNA